MRIIEERFYITREKPVNTEYYDFAVDTVYVAEDNGFLKDSGYTLLAGKCLRTKRDSHNEISVRRSLSIRGNSD